jgi:hypothetical protein
MPKTLGAQGVGRDLSEALVALQGTLDTFELPDVLRLLASTKKTGRLLLRGSRGDGSVWVKGGKVTEIDALGIAHDDQADGLFELLRETSGAFVFEADSDAPAPGTPREVEPLLVEAEAHLAEWRAIEAVVPSLDAWVSLSPQLPSPEVVVDASTWQVLVGVAGGTTVGELGLRLGLGELPVCRVVRDIVVAGLGEVSADVPEAAYDDVDPEPASWTGVEASEPLEQFDTVAGDVLADAEDDDAGVADGLDDRGYDDAPIGGDRPVFAVDDLAAPPPAAFAAEVLGADAFADADPDEADELARQLSMLSPRAAEAIAAAAAADTQAERDAALEVAMDSEGDEPINRGLLLKFLSSVRS